LLRAVYFGSLLILSRGFYFNLMSAHATMSQIYSRDWTLIL